MKPFVQSPSIGLSRGRLRVRRWGMRLILLLLVSTAISAALLIASFAWRGDLMGGDFLVFYSASRLLLAGEGV